MKEDKTHSTAGPVTNDWESRSHINTLVLMAVTAVGIYLCYRLLLPFLPALAWALALAVVFAPVHRWIESKAKRPNFAALISVLLVALVVLGLATFVGRRLVQEAIKGASAISKVVQSGEWRQTLEKHPRLKPFTDWVERQDVPGTITSLATGLGTQGAALVKGSVTSVIGVLLTFYLLFFFLRDRREALQALRGLSPLSRAEMDRMIRRVNDTIFATIYGTAAVAAVQGVLGGLMFWWLGVPAALLWGVVMALLSMVPLLGAFVVWVPAALFLLIQGSWVKALILTAWGAGVVGTIDNLLRPVLVGRRLNLHTVLAFISVVGGLLVFGSSGLVLGPVILAITTVLLEIWRERQSAAAKTR